MIPNIFLGFDTRSPPPLTQVRIVFFWGGGGWGGGGGQNFFAYCGRCVCIWTWVLKNHLEERLLDQVQGCGSYIPLFGGHLRSIPQGMILQVQPLVRSLFCPIKRFPNLFF